VKNIELIKNVRRDEDNEDSWIDPGTFKEELDAWHLELYDFDDRFKSYWIARHYCTDSRVGLRAYYLDGEPVCGSHQGGRKCEESFEWISQEAAEKVLEYMKELAEERGQKLNVNILNPEDELGDGYYIKFATQVMDYTVIYDGKEYPVDKESTNRQSYINEFIVIETEEGKKKVDLEDCLFPWRIEE